MYVIMYIVIRMYRVNRGSKTCQKNFRAMAETKPKFDMQILTSVDTNVFFHLWHGQEKISS